MPEKPKVLFLPRWYPYPGDPMLGLFTKHHAVAVKLVADVAVLYVHADENGYLQGIHKETEEGIFTVRTYYKPSTTPLLGPILNLYRYYCCQAKGYREILKHWGKPGICHIHVLTRTAMLPLRLWFTQKIPFVITEHWSRYLPGNSIAYRSIIRKLFTRYVVNKARAVTTVTSVLAKAMKSHKLENPRYFVTPNVVDINRFHPAEKQKKPYTFLHVSCFDEKAKNVSGTLRAVKRLSTLFTNFRLVLVGTGEDFDAMVAYAKVLGLEEQVVFTGLLTGDKLVTQYQQADSLVLFSHYETQGIVLLEAFACGIPVIASNAGGIPEVVADERGILVEPGDEKKLLNAMLAVIDGYRFASPETLHKYVRDNFSNEAIAAKFSEIYHLALKA